MATLAPFPLVNPPQSAMPISSAACAAREDEEYTQVRRNRKANPPTTVPLAAAKPRARGKGQGRPKKEAPKAVAAVPKASPTVTASPEVEQPMDVLIARIPLSACLGQATAPIDQSDSSADVAHSPSDLAAAQEPVEKPPAFLACFTSTGARVSFRLGMGRTPQEVVDGMGVMAGMDMGRIVGYSRSLTKDERNRERECIQARADRLNQEKKMWECAQQAERQALAEERRQRAMPECAKPLHTKKCGWCKETARYREANTQRCSSCKEKGYLEVVYNK